MKRTKLKKKVLAEGEQTGHAHIIDIDVYEREDKVKEFDGETTIQHQEHKPIKLPNNKWASDQVLEYDYTKDMVHKVID